MRASRAQRQKKELLVLRRLSQVALILLICVVCEGISAILPFPFPGSVLSMLLMLLLFSTKILKPEQIKESSDFLLGHMMLVFLPSFVSIMNYFDMLKTVWIQFALIVIISTVVTFFVGGLVVSLVSKLQARLFAGKENQSHV